MDLVKLRYIGGDRVRVPKLNRVVEPDELVGVPRDVFDRYSWPEAVWQREDEEQTPPGSGRSPADAGSQQQAPAEQAGAKSRKAGGGDA